MNKKYFVAYYYFASWSFLSLGISICVTSPNIEIHLPFGFIRIGWSYTHKSDKKFGFDSAKKYLSKKGIT